MPFEPIMQKVPILMYHSISHHGTPRFRQFVVSPELFDTQMSYLSMYGYTPITVGYYINTLLQGKSTKIPLPKRPVILTFDDGFADFYTEAFPILKKYNFPATLYVTTGFVNSTSRWLVREGETARQMISWEQLQEVSDWGIECGAHSHNHCQLDMVSLPTAASEIEQSKDILESHLGKVVTTFAYPFGYHTKSVRNFVRSSGYTSACAVGHTICTEATDPFALTRFLVKGGMDMSAFAALLSQRDALISTHLQTLYLRMRTPAWRLVRRSSALIAYSTSRGGR